MDGKIIGRRVGRAALAALVVGAVAVSQFVRASTASADELRQEVGVGRSATVALADEQVMVTDQLMSGARAFAAAAAVPNEASRYYSPGLDCRAGTSVCKTTIPRQGPGCIATVTEYGSDPDPKIVRVYASTNTTWTIEVMAPIGFTARRWVRVYVQELCLAADQARVADAQSTADAAMSAASSAIAAVADTRRDSAIGIAEAKSQAAAAAASAGAAAGATVLARQAADNAAAKAEAALVASGSAADKATAAKAAADAGVQAAAAAKSAADAAKLVALQAGDDVDALAASVGAMEGSVAANSAAIAALQAGGGSAWTSADIGAVRSGITDLWDKLKEASERAEKGRSATDPGCAENKRSDWWAALSAAPTDPCEINEGTIKRQAERSEAASKAAELGRRAYEEAKASEAEAKAKEQWDKLLSKLKEGQDKAAESASGIGDKLGKLGEGLRALGEGLGPGSGKGQLPVGGGSGGGFGAGIKGKIGAWQDVAVCTVPTVASACTAPWRIELGHGVVFEPIPSKCAPWEPTVRLWIGAAMLVAAVMLGVRWIISSLGVDTPEGES